VNRRDLSRTLKIEEGGDRWTGTKPKIRIMGLWLKRAGFEPGGRVRVRYLSQGLIVLQVLSGKSSADE
jgi:hypothetical protein